MQSVLYLKEYELPFLYSTVELEKERFPKSGLYFLISNL